MPPITLPFSRGLVTDPVDVDWLDALPVNMIAVPKEVLGHPGYMRSWPGLSARFETGGPSRGAVNNEDQLTTFRVQGTNLIGENGNVLVSVGGVGHAAMPFSSGLQGVVSANNLNFWDGTDFTQLQNWAVDEHAMGDPATTFDIGEVLDAVFVNGRYSWIKRNSGEFGSSDIENPQRPSYIAPFVNAGVGFDRNVGIGVWNNSVVIFGRNTIEFFTPTGLVEPVYKSQRSLTVQAGIVGVAAKCDFQDLFAIVGGPKDEPPSVYIVGQGGYVEIATRRIQKIIDTYNDAELTLTRIEPIKFRDHDGFIIQLPNHTLFYDGASSSDTEKRWSILSTSTNSVGPYRGIYHIYANGGWTAGDRVNGTISNFRFDIASHMGLNPQFELFTPMAQLRNVPISNLEIDNIPGYQGEGYGIAFASTRDGEQYSADSWIDVSAPLVRSQRILKRKLGYCKNNIGFRLRWITGAPSSVSKFRIVAGSL